MINRRKLITGLISFVVAPAVVRAESLMKLPTKKFLSEDEIIKFWSKLINYEAEKLARQIELNILYGSVDVGNLITYENDSLIYKVVETYG